MPIVYRNKPAEATEAVRTGLELMASKSAFKTPRLHSAFTEKAVTPLTEQALPVYNLGLSDIAASPTTKASIHTGWRYTLKQNDEIIAHAETVIDPNSRHLFAGTNEGPLVEGTEKAIKAAEEQSEIKKGNFEARLLFVPALHVTALWLADKERKADFAVPIKPVPSPLIPNKLIPLEDLLVILQEKARSVIESYRDEETLVG
ncbi:MAG TPA: hypothetical protein HA262_15860 [Methanosarcina sp.]|jgi:hypothetical protein|nr:hypothetical protein [Methanosarcina sp.]